MEQILSHHFFPLMLVFVLAFVAGIVVWLTLVWGAHRRVELGAALAQDMLNRGMSAEQIERVLRALPSGIPAGGGSAENEAPSPVGAGSS